MGKGVGAPIIGVPIGAQDTLNPSLELDMELIRVLESGFFSASVGEGFLAE